MSLITRKTAETSIRVELGRTGTSRIDTEVPFLDHMMTTLARYSGLALDIQAGGDLKHHIIEDVAIAVGMAFRAEFAGPIARFGHAVVPMDDALVECALDCGGRPYYRGPLPSSLYDHWMRSFSDHADLTIHLVVRRGTDRHHIIEAGFKALGMALRQADQPAAEIASTKGAVRLGA
jgi:imidazoleglycerol-phosphate dehydratase